MTTTHLQFQLWLDLQSLLYSSMNHTSVSSESPTFKTESYIYPQIFWIEEADTHNAAKKSRNKSIKISKNPTGKKC